MKSLRSCLFAVVVLAMIVAGAYWIYQKMAPAGDRPIALESSRAQPRLTLNNGTPFRLTVVLRGPREERFVIAPGQAETREIPAGDYQVEGQLADSATDPFTSSWTFEPGGTYDAGFSRDGDSGALLVVRPPTP